MYQTLTFLFLVIGSSSKLETQDIQIITWTRIIKFIFICFNLHTALSQIPSAPAAGQRGRGSEGEGGGLDQGDGGCLQVQGVLVIVMSMVDRGGHCPNLVQILFK